MSRVRMLGRQRSPRKRTKGLRSDERAKKLLRAGIATRVMSSGLTALGGGKLGRRVRMQRRGMVKPSAAGLGRCWGRE